MGGIDDVGLDRWEVEVTNAPRLTYQHPMRFGGPGFVPGLLLVVRWNTMGAWQQQSLTQLLAHLRTDGTGLTSRQVRVRLRRYGSNALPERKRPGVIAITVREIKNPLLLILAGAAGVAIALGEVIDGSFILVTLAIAATFGIGMAVRAEHALDALKGFLEPVATVVRDGREREVRIQDIVPGDRLLLSRGMRLPADVRILGASALEADESMLTGESLPVAKTVERGALFQGTTVVEGSGVAVVVATGASTELASIAASLSDARERTPLQVQLDRMARFLACCILAVAAALLVIGTAMGRPFTEMLTTTIAVAVASVPEGIAVAVTAILAVGTFRLAQRNCLVRRIIAAETLGSVSVILTDKTGTITEGRMRVEAVRTLTTSVVLEPGTAFPDDVRWCVEAAAIGTEVVVANPEEDPNAWEYIGSTTEAALVGAAGVMGMDPQAIRAHAQIFDRLPFSNERKYSATLVEHREQEMGDEGADSVRELILIGAPEHIVPDGRLPPAIAGELERQAAEGFRLVGVSRAVVSGTTERITELGDPALRAQFLGLFLIRDPLRATVVPALAAARAAGVRTVMVTGDHPATARRIAQDVGLTTGAPTVMTGSALAGLRAEELAARIEGIDVFARVTHAQKADIVAAWRSRGAVVAVTGDGVNDAPALHDADVGIAMGSGTDVSREAADLVLLDDRYETIVAGIEGGRVIWDNLRKMVAYLLISSFTEILLIGASVLSALPLLILPAQILWVNLVVDTFPAAALAFEPVERGVMRERPRRRGEPLLNRELRVLIFGIGVATNLLLIAVGMVVLRTTGDLEVVRTLMFVALAATAIVMIFPLRALRAPFWRSDLRKNRPLIVALGIAVGLMGIGLLAAPFQALLRTVAMPWWAWAVVAALALVNVVIVEVVKAVFRNAQRRTHNAERAATNG